MPIYEFLCPACDTRFDELAASGTEVARCPQCGSEEARRQFSGAPAPSRRLTMSPGTARRAEEDRGTNRGGAMQRFRKQRAREKRTGPSGG